MSAVTGIGTPQILGGAATTIGSVYVSSASATANSHIPDGFAYQTKLASVTVTPSPDTASSVAVLVTASFKWSITGSGGNLAYGTLGLHDATFNGWRNNALGQAASGSTTSGIATLTQMFSETGNVATEFALYGKRLNSSDTVTITDIDLRVEAIRR